MTDAQYAKFLVAVNASVPLALLAYDGYHHRLGANPFNFAIHTTGMLTLIFLLLTLCVTPVRKLFSWNFASNFRRMLGLYAFFYCCLHFLLYFAFDKSGSLAAVFTDVRKRPFILFGMTGLLLMLPLAITSTNGMIKRMGAKRWKALHKLVYLAAIAGVLHYCLFGKILTGKPITFAAVLALLLIYRLFADRIPPLRRRPTPAARRAGFTINPVAKQG
jgi:sulfoxide reductase heme-binding subunit YedZ